MPGTIPQENTAGLESVPCPSCGAQGYYDYSGRDLMFGHHRRFDYFLCVSCRLSYIHPMPSTEEIAGFYPHDYPVYSRKQDARISRLKKAVLKYDYGYGHLDANRLDYGLAIISGQRAKITYPDYRTNGVLLDIGCSNGRHLKTMSRLGWNCVGVETNDIAVEQCRAARLTVHHGLLEDAAFPAGHFDAITARHLLEHVSDPKGFLSEVFRILKPGGQFMLETPNSDAVGRRWLKHAWYANDIPRHLFLQNIDSLRKLGQITGFIVGRIRHETSPGIFLNTVDYIYESKTSFSRRSALCRLAARIYTVIARSRGVGDTLTVSLHKPLA